MHGIQCIMYTARTHTKSVLTKPWQPDSFYPPLGHALYTQQTYFPFSFDLNTHTGWLAERSKVCSLWIDPLWYQSAKRSVHLCAKSSSSSPSLSLFDCVFKNRNQTRQNENWFYFQHITSHFVFKVYIRLRMLTRLNHAKSFHTTSRDWKCKKLWILNLYWHLCRGSFYFILLFYDVLYIA